MIMDNMDKKIVKQIDEGMNRKDIYCTSYQMRNFFNQFGDGFFYPIDFMNLVQHFAITKMIKKGQIVVDFCCGRSLLCPLIKYHKKDIGEYIGIDICESNINEAKRLEEKRHGYPFPHRWILSDIIDTSKHIPPNSIDMVVYTSAIEHSQPDVGYKSLIEAFKILKPNGIMVISAPNTQGDGYNVQYKLAHIYEWSYDELVKTMKEIGFIIEAEYGIFLPVTKIEKILKIKYPEALPMFDMIREYIPNEFLSCIYSIPFPKESKETLFICQKPSNQMRF